MRAVPWWGRKNGKDGAGGGEGGEKLGENDSRRQAGTIYSVWRDGKKECGGSGVHGHSDR